jgi:hypothetical protein
MRLNKKIRWRAIAILAIAATACLGAAVGDVMYVNSFQVNIRNGKRAFNEVVAVAAQGESVTVLEVGSDGWLKVRYKAASSANFSPPPVEGYAYGDSFSARPLEVAATGPSNGNAATVGAAAASKGVLDSGQFAQAKGLSELPFYKMVVDSHGSITDPMFDEFTRNGLVGPYKPNPAPATNAVPATNPAPAVNPLQ